MRDIVTLAGGLRALLLDFDGVILHTATLKTDAFADLYLEEPPDVLERIRDYARRHGGVSRHGKIAHIERSFFDRSDDAADVDRLAERFRAKVYGAVLAAPFVPGALRLFELASGKLDLHVVSGTPHEELVDIVGRRELARWFATVRGAPPTKRVVFERLLSERGYAPREALALGDALTEYEAARDLGVPFLGVLYDGVPNPFPPDVPVVPSLEAVPALIGLDRR